MEKQSNDNNLERLNRALAECGFGSRRHCESLIIAGLVTVDGEVVRDLGRRVNVFKQDVRVDGDRIVPAQKVYYLLNKPVGVFCTNSSEEKRLRAIDLIQDPQARRLFCVGRLDADSEGLIVLTNDGDFANHLTHPRYGVTKIYFVKVKGMPTPEALEKAQKGVHLAEGRTGGMRVFVQKKSRKFSILHVSLREGKNRIIRRVFAKLGLAVLELKRVQIGPVRLDNLKSGQYRKLTPHEVRQLQHVQAPKPDRPHRPFRRDRG